MRVYGVGFHVLISPERGTLNARKNSGREIGTESELYKDLLNCSSEGSDRELLCRSFVAKYKPRFRQERVVESEASVHDASDAELEATCQAFLRSKQLILLPGFGSSFSDPEVCKKYLVLLLSLILKDVRRGTGTKTVSRGR
jgi:hypothetical protein